MGEREREREEEEGGAVCTEGLGFCRWETGFSS